MMRRAVRFAAVVVAVLSAVPLQAQFTNPLVEELIESMRWRSIGPANMMGRVTDVEGIPSPSKTFYVASAAGGIWKTTNNGITFRALFQNERVVAMGDIAIDPSNTEIIWAGTGEEDSRNSISPGGGIYKSVDGGLTWELKGLEETQIIARIVVHPFNSDVVYVAALGHIWDSNPERGLYRTADGGETWELVKFISDKAGFVDLVMHPQNPSVLFASSWERVRGPWFLNSGGPGSALWKSTDGGDSWSEVDGGGFPTTTKGRIGIAIAMSNPDIMYALVEAEDDEDGSRGNGLYRSEDGGTTWEKVNDANSRPFYYSQVRVDPSDPDRVYWSSTPVQFSTDGGRTAMTTTNGIHVDHHAMWIDPNDSDRILVGNDGGVAITWDRGGNWEYLNRIALGQFYHVSYNMDYPYRVCGGLQDNGTWCAPSRVARGQISNYHWASINGGDGFYSAQDPSDPDIVFAESQGGNMARINTATGETVRLQKPGWQDAWRLLQDSIVLLQDEDGNPRDSDAARRIEAFQGQASADSAALQLRWNWNTPFFISPHDGMTFYTAANRVFKSTRQGDDMQPISPDLSDADPEKIRVSTQTTGGITRDVTGAETHATIVALAESPVRQGMLFAGTDDGNVWLSMNDGGDWTELTDRFEGVPENTWVSRIEPSHYDADRFYVTFDGHNTNDFTPYVYVTEDRGASFSSIAEGLPTGKPDFVHVIREDPHNQDLLFVGTDLGVHVSTDRGATWQKFMTGLPTVPVHDLQIHPRERELIAATHGRSIWIANIQPLEELSERRMAEAAVLFTPTTAFQYVQPRVGGESVGQAFFQRPSPGTGAQITYYLSEDVQRPAVEGGGRGRRGDGARRQRRGGRGGAGGGQRGARGQRGGGGGPGGVGDLGAQQGPQAEITIRDQDGNLIRTLTGPATAGIHQVGWNFRGEAPPAAPKSPSQVRDSIRTAERIEVVSDSLIEAGRDEAEVRRLMGFLEGGGRGFGRGGRGGRGGGAGGDPEEFVERPGESDGRGRGGFGGIDFNEIREIRQLITPGARGGFGGGRGGGAQGALAEPGIYTVTLSVGGQEYTSTLTVERLGG